jgi:hypothetical protein
VLKELARARLRVAAAHEVLPQVGRGLGVPAELFEDGPGALEVREHLGVVVLKGPVADRGGVGVDELEDALGADPDVRDEEPPEVERLGVKVLEGAQDLPKVPARHPFPERPKVAKDVLQGPPAHELRVHVQPAALRAALRAAGTVEDAQDVDVGESPDRPGGRLDLCQGRRVEIGGDPFDGHRPPRRAKAFVDLGEPPGVQRLRRDLGGEEVHGRWC